jgi:hypothetical protein
LRSATQRSAETTGWRVVVVEAITSALAVLFMINVLQE